jgi:hypothetical protein
MGVTIVSAILISFYYKEVAFANTEYVTLEFQSAYCNKPVSVGNARWEIIMVFSNKGTTSILIKDLLVNKKPINEYKLKSGDSLTNEFSIGTSIPKSGLIIEPGQDITEYLWIGYQLYSPGTAIEIQIENINKASIIRNVVLR